MSKSTIYVFLKKMPQKMRHDFFSRKYYHKNGLV